MIFEKSEFLKIFYTKCMGYRYKKTTTSWVQKFVFYYCYSVVMLKNLDNADKYVYGIPGLHRHVYVRFECFLFFIFSLFLFSMTKISVSRFDFRLVQDLFVKTVAFFEQCLTFPSSLVAYLPIARKIMKDSPPYMEYSSLGVLGKLSEAIQS